MKRHLGWLLLLSLAAFTPRAAVAADAWQIDPMHSSSQFAVTHFMIATVRGDFGKTSGTIEYDGTNVSSIKVDATIDAASVSTRNEFRDKHLKSEDFLDVAKFPTLTFKSKKVVAGTGGRFQLVGDLTLHGVTKEVTLDVTGPSKSIKGPKGESRVAATATTTINRQDFGVKWSATMDGGGAVASDTVAITIDIEAMRPPPATPPPAAAK